MSIQKTYLGGELLRDTQEIQDVRNQGISSADIENDGVLVFVSPNIFDFGGKG